MSQRLDPRIIKLEFAHGSDRQHLVVKRDHELFVRDVMEEVANKYHIPLNELTISHKNKNICDYPNQSLESLGVENNHLVRVNHDPSLKARTNRNAMQNVNNSSQFYSYNYHNQNNQNNLLNPMNQMVNANGQSSNFEAQNSFPYTGGANSPYQKNGFEMQQNTNPYQMSQSMPPYQMNQNMAPYQMNQFMTPRQMNQNMPPYQMNQNMSPRQMNQNMSPYQMNQNMASYQMSAPTNQMADGYNQGWNSNVEDKNSYSSVNNSSNPVYQNGFDMNYNNNMPSNHIMHNASLYPSIPNQNKNVHPAAGPHNTNAHPSLAPHNTNVHPSVAPHNTNVHPTIANQYNNVHPAIANKSSNVHPTISNQKINTVVHQNASHPAGIHTSSKK